MTGRRGLRGEARLFFDPMPVYDIFCATARADVPAPAGRVKREVE